MAQQAGRTPPKYRQVADDLRARIEAGEYPVDGLLPTKPELMRHYGASLGTVDHAIAELRKLGLVETVQGVGMFARKPPEPEPSAEYPELAERMTAELGAMQDLRRRVDEQQQLLVGIKREVQDHARLLARMRRGLETAGITLADADQRDAQAM
jgi:DNA-binding GntR family transcriptional regulator